MVRRCKILINGNRCFMVKGRLVPMTNYPEEFKEKYQCVFSGSQIDSAIDTYLGVILSLTDDDRPVTTIELIWV